uniref:Uncharacterized protein n=1 Tax=Plectus sambesii TaxID=2011161 RepID=A0A914VW19_9BILA
MSSTPSRKPPILKRFRTISHLVLEDWILSAVLGVVMAVLSFVMDYCIEVLTEWRLELYYLTDKESLFTAAIIWILFSLVLVLGATVFCHIVAPQAIVQESRK